jgi:hypothetical protein
MVPIFSGADGNGDGTIDNDDFDIWRGTFGDTSRSGAGAANSDIAVPEPESAFLLLVLVSLVLRRQRGAFDSHIDSRRRRSFLAAGVSILPKFVRRRPRYLDIGPPYRVA